MDTLPLLVALEAAGTDMSAFADVSYRENLDAVFEAAGADGLAHIPPAKRGRGAGTGRRRFVSYPAALMIGLAWRLRRHGLEYKDALRVAAAFVFMGETGTGHRAIVPADQAAARGPGELFPADLGPTFALVIPARVDAPEAVAFVPARDLTARNLLDWAGLNDADTAGVVLLNVSAIAAQIEAAARADTAARRK